MLLATFDGSDNVIDLYVTGPTGRLATYYQNNPNQVYYYLNDHLGSARGLVNSTGQAMRYAYYPFGDLIEASGSHATEFQFTGKERDDHGLFEFDYFGARYYNYRVGSFTTVDKASQFASGYVYGANDPILLIDKDGNFAWFVPLLLGVAMNTAMNSNSIHNFGDFGKFAAIGASSGLLGAGVGNMIGNAVKVGGFVGGAVSGAAGGFAGGFASGAGNAWATNSNFGEGLVSGLKGGAFGAASGAAIGGIVGGINAKHNGGNFWNGKTYLNEVGGSSGGVQLDETIPSGGKPTATGEIAKTATNPKYGQYGPDVRNGGLKAHNGVDYAGDVGDDVYAMYDGTVSDIFPSKSLGDNLVRATSTINEKVWFVDYGHMSEACVRVNELVVKGDQVGLMGRSGIEAGYPTHVHIQVWRYIDNVQSFVMPSWEEY